MCDTDTASPLHGVPILLKNNIATKDKMNNTGQKKIPPAACI